METGRKKEKKPYIEKSFYEDDKYLYEEIFDKKYKFIRYDLKTKKIDYVDKIVTEDEIIKPIMGDEVVLQTVILPKKAKDYESVEKLDKEIEEHIKKWLDIDEQFLRFAVWNIRFSWLYDKFNTLNYLRALGDTGSGKSRFLDVLGNIHYKPMMVSGALTPAPIFRLINKWQGTLLIDEGDQRDSDEANAFIKILNCGYEKRRNVMRCDTNDKEKLNFFNVFCPKVITTRKRFKDKATESRCLTNIMIETNRSDIPDILTKSYYQEAEDIRQKLLLYRLKNYNKIDPEIGLKVDLSMFEPRLRQINRSFISLFSHDEKSVKNFKEFLTKYQLSIISERADTFDGSLVNAIANLITEGNENISPSMVAEYINNHTPYRYPADSRGVGKHAKGLGLEFNRKWTDSGTKNLLFLDKNRLSKLFNRYVCDVDLLKKLDSLHYVITFITLLMEKAKKRNHYLVNEKPPLSHKACNTCNDRNVSSITKIHSKCKYCGSIPCIDYDPVGNPFCKDCADYVKKKYEITEQI